MAQTFDLPAIHWARLLAEGLVRRGVGFGLLHAGLLWLQGVLAVGLGAYLAWVAAVPNLAGAWAMMAYAFVPLGRLVWNLDWEEALGLGIAMGVVLGIGATAAAVLALVVLLDLLSAYLGCLAPVRAGSRARGAFVAQG